jgi:hypothetical protein
MCNYHDVILHKSMWFFILNMNILDHSKIMSHPLEYLKYIEYVQFYLPNTLAFKFFVKPKKTQTHLHSWVTF